MGTGRIRAAVAVSCVVSVGVVAGVPASDAVVTAPRPEQCTQRAAHRTHDEWTTCVGVRIDVASAPALGEDALVTVTVTSGADRPNLAVALDTPGAMPFVGATGVRTVRRADSGPAVQRVLAATPLRVGGTRTLRYRVHAATTGVLHLRAVARAVVSDDRIDAADDDVYLTVGRTRATSRFGAPSGPTRSATVAVPAGARRAAPTPSDLVATTPVAGRQVAARAPRAALPVGQSCVSGGFFFHDNNGVTRPAVNETVRVWGGDRLTGSRVIGTTVVGWDGRYRVCYLNPVTDFFWLGYQEVQVDVVTMNTIWRVRDTAASNRDYMSSTAIVRIADQTDFSFGDVTPSDTTLFRPMHAFDSINKLWNYVHGANSCFDPNDASCRQMVVNWTSTSTDGTYYSLGGNDIHLAAADPDAPTTVIHEGSHAVMDDLYEDAFPAAPSCNPHSIFGVTSQGCAWTEGFAEWLPAMVLDDPFYRWPSGASLNLELPNWYDINPKGDALEGRVAGAMIDISDSVFEGTWDVSGEGFTPQWRTLVNQVSNTFNEFLMSDRPAQGYTVDDTLVLPAAYQNTIDYGFRDPLPTRTVLTRPGPPSPLTVHNHSFVAPGGYWSVVGQRPVVGSDYDMVSYTDRALTNAAAGSSRSLDAVDFVAYNGNGALSRTVFPQTTRYSGTGAYRIEGVAGAMAVGSTGTGTFNVDDILDVRDVYQQASVQTYYRVVPSASTDVSIHLMSLGSGAGATGAPAISADGAGIGGEEFFVRTEGTSQWDGLVVVNKTPGAAGTFTMYRDVTAPTGTMTIGATNPATTNTRSVTLAVNAADADTGIRDMRVSTDGVFDTEPFVPYATNPAVTLLAGAGAKTVWVQVRNNANMVANFADTITYDTRPNLRVIAVSNPPATTQQGLTFAASDTTRNTGPTTDSVATTTQYVLSLDGVRDASDVVLGARGVPVLAQYVSDVGSPVTLTVPMTTKSGNYYLMACADSGLAVFEFSETDNCRISTTKVAVQTPDYAVVAVTNPPATSTLGGTFSFTDTTKNNGLAPATVPSLTRFYLSVDATAGAGDILLGASRGVAALAAGAGNTGTKTLTIPLSAAHGTYYVIACADYGAVITETSETNNCRASVSKVTF